MRIRRLTVHNIRRHADLSLDFAPGLTVVYGPNEAGKSTLQRAIEMALFRSATSTAQELTELRSWGATPEDEPTIELCFESDGAEGMLFKSFARSAGTVRLELGGQVLGDPRQVDQAIAELTGLPSEKFFRSTAGIRHAEVTALDGDAPELRDRLQQAISGADRGTAPAIRSLTEVIRLYRAEGTKNPGKLKQARDEIARLSAEVAAGERELDRLERDRAALAAARTRRSELEQRLATDQASLAAADGALELARRATDAEQRYARYKRAAEIREELGKLDATHPSSTPLPQLKDAVERLRQQEIALSRGSVDVAGDAEPPALSAMAEPDRSRTLLVAAGGLAIVGLLLVAGGLVLGAGAPAIALGSLLLVVGAGLAAYGVRLRGSESDGRIAGERLAAEAQDRAVDIAERTQALERTTRERNALLASIGAPDLATAEATLDAESRHAALVDRLRAEERGLLQDAAESGDVAALRDAAAADGEKARFALSGMGADVRDLAAERQQLRASVDSTRRQLDQAMGEAGNAEGRVGTNTVDAEAVARATEGLAQAEDRLRLAERRLRIYLTTRDAIAAAEQQTMRKAARVLEETMGSDVAAITGGRYRRIEVDEGSLAFRVYSVERGDWIPAASLSHGTRDQLYLAARLGLVRQITGDHRPPLILDDPFVSFDDGRATRAVQLLKQVGADFQVILLTCSTRYNALADLVVELPAPMGVEADSDDSDGAGGVLAAPDVASEQARTASAIPEETIPEPPAPPPARARPVNTAQTTLWDEPEPAP